MKKVLYLGLVIISFFGFFLAKVYMFDHQQFVKEYLAKLDESKFEITTQHISSLKVGLTPYIEIKNIDIKDKAIATGDNQIFVAQNIKLELSLYDILLGKKIFKAIKLTAPTLNVLSDKVMQEYANNLQQAIGSIKIITITDGNICDLVTKDCTKYISQFSLKIANNKALSTLNLNWGEKPEDKYELAGTLKENSDISATINGVSGKFVLNAKLANGYINGDISGDIFNPKLLLTNIIKPFSLPKNIDITNNKEAIKVSSKILLGLDKLILSDIKFDSKDVNGLGSISYSSEDSAKININFDKFIASQASEVVTQDSSNLATNISLDDNFASNEQTLPILSDREAFINFKELVLGDKKFTNLAINYAIKDSIIYTANVEGLYNNEVKFALKNPNYNQQEKVLSSDFSLDGKNLDAALALFMPKDAIVYKDKEIPFSLFAKLTLSSTELNLNDIELKVVNALVKGNLKKKLEINPEYSGNIDFSNFDFSNLSLNNFKEVTQYFCLNSHENAYLAKFKILRELKSKIKLDINIDNSSIDNLQIKNMASKITIEKGQVKIDKLAIDSDFAQVDKLQFALDARSLNPNMTIDIQANKLDFDYVKNMFGLTSNDEDTSLLTNEMSATKIIANSKTEEQIKSVWSNEALKFFRFDKFLGSVKLDLQNVYVKNNKIDNVEVSLALKDETLLIDTMKLKWNNSDADLKGAISQDYDQTIVSINCTANNLDVALIAEYLDIKKIKGGRSNFIANIYTTGASKAALINNLDITMPFVIKDFLIDGFNLESLILKSANDQFNSIIAVKSFLSKAFDSSVLEVKKVSGLFKATRGVIQSKDVKFETNYSAGVFGGVVDLNKMILKSQSNISFVPGQQAKPVVIAISNYGNLKNFDSAVNYDLLEQYLTSKIKPEANDPNINMQ